MTAPDPRRWWGLGALALALLALGFDLTILNVALPTLSAELHAGTSALQWIVDSYVLVFAALLLPAGLLGDRFGRKRLLLAGLALFGAASLGGALADGTTGVIVARTCMGLGAAVVLPLSMSMLPAIFPPHERTRAVAVWSASMALGLPLGPLLGGWLLEHYWWGSIFLVNVPVVVLGGLAVAFLLPESRDPAAPRVDVPGAALSMAGLVALVYGVIEGPVRGWADPLTLGAVLGGLALLAAFVRWESRAAEPLVDVALFRDRVFVGSVSAAVIGTLVMSGALFVLPQYLQVVRGHDAFGTGLRLIPMLAGLMAGGLLTDRLVPRTGAKPVMTAGLLTLTAGLGAGAFTGADDAYTFTGAWLGVMGLGIGMTLVPAMDAVLARLPDGQAGRGSGLVQTLRQTAAALGVAGLGSLVSSVYRGEVSTGGLPEEAAVLARDSIGGAASAAARLGDPALLASARDAYVSGMDAALAVCALATFVTGLLLWVFLPAVPPERAPDAGDAAESDHEHVAS
ncbi:DHA2 family efflux MFS transporter permease subunit [Actinomadura hibisca]|uniref:DHA2 family efflux MFS transporter permease subunit n=1 Tax=Actinomadura hibisca TaxID=68565 RepID=UPI0008353F4B|nr:DHA2 family efflux MFS transporter permease subunit [Actinomadura hibisca]